MIITKAHSRTRRLSSVGGDRRESLSGLNADGAGGRGLGVVYVSSIDDGSCGTSSGSRAPSTTGGYVTAQVFAYLDPGSGSLIVQLLVGGVAALGVSVKMFWGRILSFLHIRRDEEESPVQEDTRS
jgi:hypothetical protein